MGQFDVTSGNWASGAGIVESFAGLATDIRGANDRDAAAVAASIGLGVVVASLDVVAVGLDPLSKLVAVGLGWLVEHVRFLRKPLDLLAGDPIAVERIAEQLHVSAQTLRNSALDLDPDVLARWHGPAADDFRVAAAHHQARLGAAGEMIDAVGYVVATNSAVIAALRALIRDMITSVLGDIVATMITATATAGITFGASLVYGVARSVASAVARVTSMLSRISRVVGLAGRSAGRIDELVHGMGHLMARANRAPRARAAPAGPAPAPRGAGFHDDGLGDDVYRDWLKADEVLNGRPPAAVPPPVRPVTLSVPPPAPPVPPSARQPSRDSALSAAPHAPTKRYEVPMLNQHQGWLDARGFGAAQRKAKFVDEWLKLHAPAAYPHIKAVSDADSSKNYLGLEVKAATGFARQLTDIHERAEVAWNATERDRP